MTNMICKAADALPARAKLHRSIKVLGRPDALIALGANESGRWGAPCEALAIAATRLEAAGLVITARSAIYVTSPLGPGRQKPYFNAAIAARVAGLGPTRLLALLKRLERMAGRTRGLRWGPRPLDLDIIHVGHAIRDWPPPRARDGRLILPHPEAHRRRFVLVPLTDVAPGWRHPVLGVTPAHQLRRLAMPAILARRAIRRLPPGSEERAFGGSWPSGAHIPPR